VLKAVALLAVTSHDVYIIRGKGVSRDDDNLRRRQRRRLPTVAKDQAPPI